jgi:hypothetical protein
MLERDGFHIYEKIENDVEKFTDKQPDFIYLLGKRKNADLRSI